MLGRIVPRAPTFPGPSGLGGDIGLHDSKGGRYVPVGDDIVQDFGPGLRRLYRRVRVRFPCF